MSTNTTNLALGKAIDADNAKTYLETTLGGALDTLDAHRHNGSTTGLPVLTLNTGTALANVGDVRVNVAAFTYRDNAGTPANHTLGALDIAQTWTAVQTLQAPVITGATLALRDTSAAYDVTITATSTSATLTAGRTLTLDVGNVAHTLAFGTTANTITFPNAASGTVPLLNLAQTFTAVQTFSAQPVFSATTGITLTAAASQIVPGATSLSLRNNANTADNLLLTDAGAATIRAGLTVSSGGINATGAITLNNGTAITATETAATSVTHLFTNTKAAGQGDMFLGVSHAANGNSCGYQISVAGSLKWTVGVGLNAVDTTGALLKFRDETNGLQQLILNQGALGTGYVGLPTVGLQVGATVSTNNQIWNASQGAGTTTLYIGNASITVSSDVRLKRNLSDAVGTALPLLRQLRIRDFEWNDPSDTAEVNRNSRGRWQFAVVAQEAIDVVPWLVNAPDRACLACRAGRICAEHANHWTVDWGHDFGLLVKAIQEIDGRLTAAGIA